METDSVTSTIILNSSAKQFLTLSPYASSQTVVNNKCSLVENSSTDENNIFSEFEQTPCSSSTTYSPNGSNLISCNNLVKSSFSHIGTGNTEEGHSASSIQLLAHTLNYKAIKLESIVRYEDTVKGESTEAQGSVSNINTDASNDVKLNEENQVMEDSPEIDIVVSNVVASFETKCHLNLKTIAMNAMHVIYKRENCMVNMKLRNPYCTATIWSSGKISVTGATTDADAKKAARRVTRILQKLGFRVKFSNFRVVNILATCSLPFAIRIAKFSSDQKHRANASYEPELHPGVTYRLKDPKATLKIFSTGSITVTAPRVENVQKAIEHIFPLVYEHQMSKKAVDPSEASVAQRHLMPTANRLQQQRRRYLRQQQQLESDEESFGEGASDDD